MKFFSTHASVNNTSKVLSTQFGSEEVFPELKERLAHGSALLGTVSLSRIFKGLAPNRELSKIALRRVLMESAALCLLYISNNHREAYSRAYSFDNSEEIEFILKEMEGKDSTSALLALQTCSLDAMLDAKVCLEDSELEVHNICMSGLLVSLMSSSIILNRHFDEI